MKKVKELITAAWPWYWLAVILPGVVAVAVVLLFWMRIYGDIMHGDAMILRNLFLPLGMIIGLPLAIWRNHTAQSRWK